MLSVKGTFRDGVALPAEAVEGLEARPVIITFLDPIGKSSGPAQNGSSPEPADLADARELERIAREIETTRSLNDELRGEKRAIRRRQNLLQAIK